MKISVTQKEITLGLVAYLNTRGFNLDAATIQVTYTQGRKGGGLTAELNEDPQDVGDNVDLVDEEGTVRATAPRDHVVQSKPKEPSTDALPAALGGTAEEPAAAEPVAEAEPEAAEPAEEAAPAKEAEPEGENLFA